MGLDCEWRPTHYGSKSPFAPKNVIDLPSDTGIKGPGSDLLEAKEDHPVATLQLAFREEIFIIDLLSLSGVVTYADSGSAYKVGVSDDCHDCYKRLW